MDLILTVTDDEMKAIETETAAWNTKRPPTLDPLTPPAFVKELLQGTLNAWVDKLLGHGVDERRRAALAKATPEDLAAVEAIVAKYDGVTFPKPPA
jgi:hypothetical protein